MKKIDISIKGVFSICLIVLCMASYQSSYAGNDFGKSVISGTNATALVRDRIEPSKDIPIKPGQKIAGRVEQRIGKPYTIQRLTKNTYWIETDFYTSTALVGREGVMLIDPLPGHRGRNQLAAVKEITPLPITTVVYSHGQYDHAGGTNIFADAIKHRMWEDDDDDDDENVLKIIATSAAAEEIEKYKRIVVPPNVILPVPHAHFYFERFRISVFTPPAGHSTDNSMILIDREKVLHFADSIWPDKLPFARFFAAQQMISYEETLHQMLDLRWDILNSGHGNIGSREDVQIAIDYVNDIRGAIPMIISGINPGQFIHPSDTENLFAMFDEFRDPVIEMVMDQLRPKWNKYEEFEISGRSHVEILFTEFFLHLARVP